MGDHTPEQRARWREIHGRPAEPKEDDVLRVVPEDGRLKPLLVVESRPSSVNGMMMWMVLSYGAHEFAEPLPMNWLGLDEMGQSLAALPVAERLRVKLAPILIAEDELGELEDFTPPEGADDDGEA